MGVKFSHKGDFKITQNFFDVNLKRNWRQILDQYGKLGVSALASSTPVRSGETAAAWSYEVVKFRASVVIRFHNSHIVNGSKIALLLQFGHATRNGGFIQGRDYINPAIRPVFDSLTQNAWKEVVQA